MPTLATIIRQKYQDEASGHDWYHIQRVTNLALAISENDDDPSYIEMLALLHEELDDKLNEVNPVEALVQLLNQASIPETFHTQLIEDILSIGFKGGFQQPNRTRAAQLVSDADLLDAMGAIGIARTFQYNGRVKHAPFYDPELAKIELNDLNDYRHKKRNAIAHFDEKLLRLKHFIVSDKAKQLADKRHQRLQQFVIDFFEELEEAGVDVQDKFEVE